MPCGSFHAVFGFYVSRSFGCFSKQRTSQKSRTLQSPIGSFSRVSYLWGCNVKSTRVLRIIHLRVKVMTRNLRVKVMTRNLPLLVFCSCQGHLRVCVRVCLCELRRGIRFLNLVLGFCVSAFEYVEVICVSVCVSFRSWFVACQESSKKYRQGANCGRTTQVVTTPPL